jgi:periplasmic protein TonB
MNKDLIIGLVSSLALHFLILNPFIGKAAAPKRVTAPKEEVIQMEMPPLDEEKEDIVKDLDDTPVENQLAPPSLVDLPSVVPINAFTQTLTPPPPPGLTPSKGAINIPVMKPGANFGKGMELFDVSQLDQKPVLRVPVQPTYPYEMSRAGINGNVTVEFIISTNGDVTQAQVVRSSHREFEVPAIQAVLKWKFKPGKRGGRAVNVRASQLIEFNLDDNK